MSVILLKEILEDADYLQFIASGAYPDIYDQIASDVFPKLSKDLSIDQIQNIIWNAFYKECCFISINNSIVELGIKQGYYILGYPIGFKNIAHDIRIRILGL